VATDKPPTIRDSERLPGNPEAISCQNSGSEGSDQCLSRSIPGELAELLRFGLLLINPVMNTKNLHRQYAHHSGTIGLF
jgi:hypothetical protein